MATNNVYKPTSAYDGYEPSGATAPKHPSEVTVLQGLTDTYSVQDWLGEGSFGRVAKCQATNSNQTVAVKILNDHQFKNMENELSMLEEISALDPVCTNIVHFLEYFEFMGQHCLAFEILDIDLFKFMEERDCVPLQLPEIRPIAHQLLVALEALKGLGIVHTDIKPDNVMLTNLQDEPLRVKLIDFGEATKTSQVQLGTLVQPWGFRAPEVTLGLPYTEAIDVWGVGCILAFLFIADNLFPVQCEYQMLKRMVDILGLPPAHLLQKGLYTRNFFTKVQPDRKACNFFTKVKPSDSTAWRLMTPDEYCAKNMTPTKEYDTYYDVPSCLDGLANIYPENSAMAEDRKAFIDLLKGMLSMTEEQRVTPSQALQHPFLTMSHLQDTKLQGYLMISEEFMYICPGMDTSSSPPEDTVSVSNVEVNVQTDAPEADAPEADAPEADAPEADTPEADVPETDAPKADTPEADAPEADAPETDAPEADAPEADAPEADTPEADAPEADVPETDAPKADTPEADAPEADAPETDTPEADAPETDAPETDAPETDAPESASTGQDSGISSLSGPTSCQHTVPPSGWDEHEPVYYLSNSEVSVILGLTEKAETVRVEDIPNTRAAKAPKRSCFQRIRRVLRRVAETLRRRLRLH